MKLLLISNSASPGEQYLEQAGADLATHLKGSESHVILVPYAAVTYSYDEYVDKVNKALSQYNIKVTGIHTYNDPAAEMRKASAILVGGGNTFMLLKMMQEQGLDEAIRESVERGVPYAGWSAGSNVTCPTLCTTNDMPIVEPKSFKALNLIPFQINPHYLDAHPSNHGGETREQRILEYIEANHNMYVLGLREGSRLLVDGESIELRGEHKARLFKYGEEIRELSREDDFTFLLHECK